MKIAIIGTHGTGKSTLSFNLAAHYKFIGKSVKIVQEVARSCPFPINEKMNIESAKWIFLEHSKKELEASRNQVVICDRSVFDSFVYAEYFKISDDELVKYKKVALSQLKEYEKLIFVRPNLFLHDDEFRSKDLEFHKSIDKIFEENLKDQQFIEITSSQIFEKKNLCKLLLL